MVTRAVEDYLKAIYKLQQDGSPATTNAIAENVGLRAASVTAMLQQLEAQGLAEYTRYRGAYLTEAGLAAALRVIRRHRLIELYLHQNLGVPWDRVHDEAERLEHAISPYLEERIDARLGYPRFDPHGAPIPSSTGALPVQDLLPLYDLPPNTPSVVRHIPDDDSDFLRYVASLGLVPDANVMVLEHDTDAGSISLEVASTGEDTPSGHVVTAEAAHHIFVSRPDASAEYRVPSTE
ncbi:MAG TPA: metal-dependent transcriptional regulator [Chloroflexia bacterium]|nr:metal-dependent transcriptional regulator [Chloroflexia bacterium]